MRIITTLFTLLFVTISFAQIGVNTTNPDNSAILDVVSTDKGFLPPRLTTAERNGIANPAEGLVIFNKSANVQCLQVYRNVDNGDGWFDICCPSAVSQLANFSAAGVLFSPDKFFTGANGTGGSVADGGEVGSVGPVDLSAFGAGYPSAGYFNHSNGSLEAATTEVTQTLLNSNINEYSASAFLTKNGDFNGLGGVDTSDDLRLDLSGVSSVYTGDFTLTVVGRYNAIPSGSFKAFFSVGQSGTTGSFQLANAGSSRYRLNMQGGTTGSTLHGDLAPSPQAVPIDTKFHLFNMVYQADVNGNPLVTFYIDGLLQTETKTDKNPRISTIIRLLNNRNGEQSVNASMAYFGLDNVAKTQAEISSLAKGIQCLFDEL